LLIKFRSNSGYIPDKCRHTAFAWRRVLTDYPWITRVPRTYGPPSLATPRALPSRKFGISVLYRYNGQCGSVLVWRQRDVDCTSRLWTASLFTAQCYACAVLAMGLCPCLCLCLSQVGVLLKRLNAGSHKQHHTIA